MKRGSIDLARRLCYEIAGATDEEDDITGSDYGSVDVAEILSAEVVRLRRDLDIAREFERSFIDLSDRQSKMIERLLVNTGMQWHQADDAPNDDVAVLAVWTEGSTQYRVAEIVTKDEHGDGVALGWYDAYDGDEVYVCPPDFWMPLPKAPNAQVQKGEGNGNRTERG